MTTAAVVTGAGEGISLLMARRLWGDGSAVALVDLNAGGLAETAEKLGRDGAQTLQVQADLTEIGNIARAIDQVGEAWGRIDALVNNAGLEVTRPFLETTEADWDAMLTLNLRTVFFATQLAARAMIAGGVHGRIVNTASIAGRSGRGDQAAYGAAEAGGISVRLTAALVVAARGTSVQSVLSGVGDTAV